MFNRKPDRGSQAGGLTFAAGGRPPQLPETRTAQPPRATGVASVIGADLSITGNLESTGEVRIEGEIQGDIHAGRIVIGPQASITGALVANEIVVRGDVQGSIRGNSVTFQAESRIEGDVFHKTLVIEQGAYFEGKSRRSENPLAQPLADRSAP